MRARLHAFVCVCVCVMVRWSHVAACVRAGVRERRSRIYELSLRRLTLN